MRSLSLEEARRLAVRCQLLDGVVDFPVGKEGVGRAIEHLGYVQIDTISVVARAHHQTLRARRKDYDVQMLHELLAEDRRIFEYWGHAASYLPMTDYRFYLPKMHRAPWSKYEREWLAANTDLVRQVYERIRKEGPLASKDFKRPDGEKGGIWWNWKPAKMALEILFSQGELTVTERRSFQRVYDLTERVLPASVDLKEPSVAEVNRFLVLRALGAHGVATPSEIRWHIKGPSTAEIAIAIEALVEEGTIVPVSIEGQNAQELYAHPEALEEAVGLPKPDGCSFLCPFDNLIIQRERIEWLFDFDYTLECYVPAQKRVHGYFVFPILFGDRLVGRLDPKADRRAKRLIVKRLTFEPWFGEIDDLLPSLATELARMARFDGCESVEFETIKPTGHKRALKTLVRRALADEG